MSIISIVSVIGVMLGVAVLVIVLSVMNGFNEMWREKILGFDAHMTVTREHAIEQPEELMRAIEQVEGVFSAAPYVQGLVFLAHDGMVHSPLMRGVDVGLERKVSLIPSHIVTGKFSLGYGEMIVGKDLAERMRVGLGDKLLVYSPSSFSLAGDEIGLPEEAVVSGIFEIGMWEYDAGFVLLPIEEAREICGMETGAQAVRVMTSDPLRAQEIARGLKAALINDYPDIHVSTWMELNRQLFNALRVEKSMMFFLLIFIVLVAAFGITNSLIITVVQKTKEIGLLKALGFSSGRIMRVFFWQGWIQGTIGILLGNGLGIIALRYRNDLMHWLASRLHVELLPKELYQLSEIPAKVSYHDLFGVAVLAMLICTLAGLIPAYRAARLDPARALRYE